MERVLNMADGVLLVDAFEAMPQTRFVLQKAQAQTQIHRCCQQVDKPNCEPDLATSI